MSTHIVTPLYFSDGVFLQSADMRLLVAVVICGALVSPFVNLTVIEHSSVSGSVRLLVFKM